MIEIYRADKYEMTVRRALEGVLSHFSIDINDVDLEMDFLDSSEMKDLNRESRGIDLVTDVLSFPSLEITLPFNYEDYLNDINPESEGVILGEIYICFEKAVQQAKEYNHSISREISFLAIHGALHLLGFDHQNDTDRDKMEREQEIIMDSIGCSRNMSDDEYQKTVEQYFSEEYKKEILHSSLGNNDQLKSEEYKKEILHSSLGNNDQLKSEEVKGEIRCGFVAVLGRPNAGKSTLINYLVGQKVAIVSWKPQTTRNKILGIRNDNDSQIIFVDTPGLHKPENELGKFMMRSVTAALNEVDIVLYLTNAEKDFNYYDQENVKRYIETGKKVVLVVNKIDRVDPPKVAAILSEISKIQGLSAVVPISAIKGKNVEPLITEIKVLLPITDRIFPEDIYTDRSMNFVISEIIREKALRLLDEEIPYGIAVSINKYEEREDGVINVDADIIVQKESHKGIVLGKGGSMIKKISTYARQDIELVAGSKVFLTLWVRVQKDWRERENILDKLGYNKTDYRGE
ncbi:MAG: GTPase Era [Firmicutes bacterium ADurb.Bin080]|jgi:GTP-binding protein Era/rRNA maturation RNase YbeY|nr:GTPase Era [Clostridiales bacterium]OQC13324.1 MAG: GTPase Era [Firmicutes bacterium ADurb.Bin080]